jgi:hypothetical protein
MVESDSRVMVNVVGLIAKYITVCGDSKIKKVKGIIKSSNVETVPE